MQWRFIFRKFFRRNRRGGIDPDEIFIDSTNLPQLDEDQFEGRIEHPLSKKTFFYLSVASVLIFIVFLVRVFGLQVLEGSVYTKVSENNRLGHSLIFADRGIIYDRKAERLAWNAVYKGEPFSKRVYINRAGIAHLVGYVGYPLRDTSGNYYQEDFVGKSGVERSLNEKISGKNGLKIIETDALENIRSESVIRPPRNGNDIRLSIDSRVTNEFLHLVEKRSQKSGFSGGAGVIMDVSTGEVLLLSSFPEYDSNALTDGGIEEVQRFLSDKNNPFLNRVVSGLYTPGSIVKPFIAVGALEEGIITPEKKILSTGVLSLPNPYFPGKVNLFKDWKAHGWVNMRRALAVSSNVYFYEIGGGYKDQPGLGISGIEKYLRLFGFGEETGIALPGEAIGIIPNPEWKKKTFKDGVWRVGDTYHTAIGQYGFQVTPIQVVRAMAAIANNGVLLTPTFIAGEVLKKKRISVDLANLDVVREGLRLGVEEGTSRGLSIPEVSIAAKTGTAELGTSKKLVNSWVTGFFPYENPRYAFAVLMERGPRDNTIGALSVMRQLLKWMSVNTPEYITPK